MTYIIVSGDKILKRDKSLSALLSWAKEIKEEVELYRLSQSAYDKTVAERSFNVRFTEDGSGLVLK